MFILLVCTQPALPDPDQVRFKLLVRQFFDYEAVGRRVRNAVR